MNTQQETYKELIDLYDIAEIKENAGNIHESLGFLYAITAVPQQLDLEIWLPMLWKEDRKFDFSHEKLASQFAKCWLGAHQQCLLDYQSRQPIVIPLSEQWIDEHLHITTNAKAFAIGYLRGFQLVEVLWAEMGFPDNSEAEQLLQTTLLLLSKLADVDSQDPKMQALFTQLPNLQEIVKTIPALFTAMGPLSERDCFDE